MKSIGINILHQPILNFVVKAGIIAVFVIGLLTYVEWITGTPLLNAVFSNYTPMKLISAALLILSSFSLWLFLSQSTFRKHILRITGGIILMVSFLTFLTYLPGNAVHLNDSMVFNFFLRENNRMALITTLIFLFLGVIFILLANNSRIQDDIAHVLFFPAASISYFSMISYVLGVSEIFRIEGINIAPSTAFCLFLLCLVILFLKPDTWLMRILLGPGPGSIIGRRLLPWLVVLPVVIAGVRIKGEQLDYFPSEVGVILVSITYTLTYLLLVWWSGLYVNKIDQKKRQAHDALGESRARLNALITATSDGVYRMSPDWKQMISMEGENFLTSVESPVDDWLHNFIPKDTQPLVLETINRAITTKSKFELEHNVIRQDGSIGWTLSRAIPVLDKDGEIVEWMGIAHDFTERRNTQMALQQSEELFSKAFYNTPIPAIITRISDNIMTHVNSSFLKLFEYSSEEVIGHTTKELNLFADYGQRMKVLELLTREGYIQDQEFNMITKTGKQLTLLLSSVIVTIQEQKHVMTTYFDITERKRNEEVLAFQSRLLSEVNDAVFSSDTDFRINYWNQRAEKMFGWTKEEALGHISGELLKPKTDVSSLEEVRSNLKNKGYWIGEGQYLRKDGTYFFVEVNSKTIKDADGKYAGQIIVARDITERKQAQEEIIAAKEKAEESDRLKSAFLANMSHELRTPLNSIIGFSELMLDPFFESDEKSKYLQIINTSGNNLLMIINDIMDISKIEAGQVQVKNKLFSVNKLMTELQEECSLKAGQKGIEIILDPLNPAEEVFMESDQTKIRQILVNLVGNAIKFTEKGFVQLSWRKMENDIEFQVKDTGIGIPADFQTQIFERFRQVESSETRKYGGTGLGLAISKSLAELLGGTIWMESKQGEGSTFYFTLPHLKA